jgi:hypothetical protein
MTVREQALYWSNMKAQQLRRSLTPVSPALASLAILVGCISPKTEVGLDVVNLEELKEVLNTTEFRSCAVVEASIKLPVPIRTANILSHDDKVSIVYEGLFRESVKTVWQPLTNRYRIEEDGVVVGNRNAPFVVDFNTQQDANRGFWTTFRSKLAGSERFFATIEYLPTNSKGVKVARVNLPLSEQETTQRIWIIPLPQPSSPAANRDKQSGVAHVFVKTVTTSGTIGDNPEGQITWFLVHAPKGVVQKMGKYRDRPGTSFLPERFLLTDGANDPTAVGLSLESSDYDEVPTGSSASGFQSRIIAMRPFLPKAPETVLHQETTNLSTLAVSSEDGSTNTMVLAWIKSTENAAPPSIFYAFHRLAVSEMRPRGSQTTITTLQSAEKSAPVARRGKEKKQAKKGAPTPAPAPAKTNITSRLAVAEIKTGYIPSRLQFGPPPSDAKGPISMMLTWIGGTDSHLALISASLSENMRRLQAGTSVAGDGPRTVALTSGNNLGRLLSATISSQSKGNVYLTYLESGKPNTPQPATLRLCVAKRADLENR